MMTRQHMVRVLAAAVGAALAATLVNACGQSSEEKNGQASARFVGHRSELIGGDRALGDIGDVLIENERIRVVIQREGFSCGFGVYGGSLIDADLRRPQEEGSSLTPVGFDQFAELFPAFFVQATAVDEVKILNDGSNGEPAQVAATGTAGDFLELAGMLNRAVTGSNSNWQQATSPPRLRYTTIYELAPKTQYITTRFIVENLTNVDLALPGRDSVFLFNILGLPLEGFTVPIGDIALFGQTSKVFIPGVGFDLRFGLERAYARNIDFPAFPGFAAEYVAAKADGVSYGIVAEESEANYVWNKRDIYDDGRTPLSMSSVLIPFVASSFTGIFYEDAPDVLKPGKPHQITKHFIVGNGDIGSIVDQIHKIRGNVTGRLAGQVFDAVTGAPGVGLSAVVYQLHDDGFRRPFAQYDVREEGRFSGRLEPGRYSVKVVGEGREATDFRDFEIVAGQTTSVRVESNLPGRIVVRIHDRNGVPLPAKATVVGRYDGAFAGMRTPEFLFDLAAGEEFRSTDLVDDDPNDPSTLEFIETVGFTDQGEAVLLVRPGDYDVVSSRGPEYDLARSSVRVRAGETVTVGHQLNRVVDTRGWVAVDTHIHSKQSIDSGMDLDERVRSIAAEGVEVAVATDHNFVTDYGPYVARNGLNPWLHSIVGIEMTTLESGHFNGYPLRYAVGEVTKGSFEWARRPPRCVFDDILERGSLGPENTIIQVNHPRDDLLGYFTQFRRHTLTMAEKPVSFLDRFVTPSGPAFVYPVVPREPNDPLDPNEAVDPNLGAFRDCPWTPQQVGQTTFDLDVDAIEILNGKLFWEVRHYRVPEILPPGDLPPAEVIPPTGSILIEEDGDVAFPGVVDDWFNLLNLGYKHIGLGTGDSHSGFDEAGQFRTMVYTGVDEPMALNDRMIVDALRSRRAVATNGPLVDFWIDDPQSGAMGRTVRAGGDEVVLHYRLTSAPWISVGRVNVYRNGTIAFATEIDPDRDLAAEPFEQTLTLPLATDASGNPIDSWFVVEAIGYRTMHPVIRGSELPPLLLTDALASLAGPLGLAGDEFGDLRPPEVFPVTGYAITNPVWVTTHGGEFVAPGLVPVEVQNLPENDPQFQVGIFAVDLVSERPRDREAVQQSLLGRVDVGARRNVPLFYPLAEDITDVRKVMARLGALGKHGPH